MADVAKTVKVVSNSGASGVSLCELTSNIETDSLEIHNSPNNTDSSDLTLNIPSPDEGSSLQELIESELALRQELIDSQFAPQGSNYEDPVEETIEENHKNDSFKSSPTVLSPQDYVEGDYEALDINTQFILAERNHSFQTFTGNDMFFFNTLDDTQINGSDYPKDEQAIDDPFLDEPSAIRPEMDSPEEVNEIKMNSEARADSSESECTDSSVIKDGIDQITLSTFDPFTTIVDSSKSEPIETGDVVETPSSECADSDFMQVDPANDADMVNGSGENEPAQNVDENIDENVGDDIGEPAQEFRIVEERMDIDYDFDFHGTTVHVNDVFERVEIEDYDGITDLIPDEANRDEVDSCQVEVIIPEIDIIPPDDNEISESELVSNEELSLASNGPEPDIDAANVVGNEGFDTWATVEEVAGSLDEDFQNVPKPTDVLEDVTEETGAWDNEEKPLSPVHDNIPVCADVENSQTADTSESEKSEMVATTKTEKKSKKKKEGDSTKTKKTKKTKKNEEKENISVNETDDSKENGDLQEKHPADAPVKDDDLSNVSVKELKSTYANQIQTKGPKEVSKEIDEDILHCGSVQSLKQNYCSEALKSFKKAENPEKKEVIATGISIKELRRSFGDLSTLCDNDDDEGVQHESAPISLDMKARSMGDLRRLSDTFHNNSMDSNKSPIHTGVSVRALRASYCSLANLLDEPAVEPKAKDEKSSFSKFDQMSKKTVLHVRSVDTTKVQKQFNESTEKAPEQTSNCKSCGKQVFQMEQIKAERAVWHKNCFRCKECNKQLTLDIYSSHEGQLYCKPHFRELFKPKAVVEEDNEPPRLRKPELIIRENQPIELPPEVVRASDKPDLGLEELSALNVKSRYQVFEKPDGPAGAEVERSPSSVSVKRSPSILSKLARFQAKGMDIGVTDESLNGIPYEESSSSSEEENEIDGEEGDADRDLIRSNRKQRERPVSFSKMEDIKCRWEQGQAAWREEQRLERKEEIRNIRSKLFMGKQGKMKEMYEQAVKDSENTSQKKEVGIRSDKAKSIKERFERGEVLPDEEDEENKGRDDRKSVDEDMSVFEAGISKKSRSLFLELDASAAKTQQQQQPMSPLKSPLIKDDVRRKSREIIMLRTPSEDVVKSSDAIEEVEVATAEISNKFKFFETYKAPEKERKLFRITPPREGQVKANSPEREIYRDPEVVRSEDKVEDEEVMKTNTAKKMLSIFRQMEENATKEDLPDGPKPLKRFTPPPEYTRDSESSEEETESEDEEEEEEEDDVGGDPNIVRASDKIEDEFLKQAQNAARAKALRAKFERWEEKENKANANAATNASHAVGNLNGGLELDQSSEHASIDTTKSLRARFESLKNETQQPKERTPRPKVNRFVEIASNAKICSVCEKTLYPLEEVLAGGKLFHKQCFRCQQCNCILRMETYTLNSGKLYCMPHFKQLFISKGNYEEGFGLDQHKRKWNNRINTEDDLLNSINNSPDH